MEKAQQTLTVVSPTFAPTAYYFCPCEEQLRMNSMLLLTRYNLTMPLITLAYLHDQVKSPLLLTSLCRIETAQKQ